MEPLLSLRDVSKRYVRRDPLSGRVDVAALSGVSLRIAPGEGLAVMGENGAGKTTLLKIAAGLVLADAGEARLAGGDAADLAHAARSVGFVPGEDRSLPLRLTVRQNLRHDAALRGMDAAALARSLAALAGPLDLDGILDRRVADLSTGQRQRAVLARALLADPPLLLLDEPSRSLDAASAERLWAFLRAERARGKGVLIATHRRDEAVAVADRVLVLDAGRVARVEDLPRRAAFAAPVLPPAAGGGPSLPRLMLASLRRSVQEEGGALVSNVLWLLALGFELATFFFLGRYVEREAGPVLGALGGGYFLFLLVWLLFQEWQGPALTRPAAEVRQGQLTGTLESTLLSAGGLRLPFLASSLASLAKPAAITAAGLLAWALAAPAPWSPAGLALAFAAAALAWISLLGVGFAGASLVLVFQRGNFIASLYAAMGALLAGAFYPTEVLPAPLRLLAEAFPLTAGLRLMRRGLLGGPVDAAVWRDLALLGLFACALLALGCWALERGTRAARRRGVLARY